MRPQGNLVRRSLLLFGISAGLACAQQFPFQLLVTSGSNSVLVANGSTLVATAAVGDVSIIHVRATYTGSGTVTISQDPQIFGSTTFTVTFAGTLPLKLNPGDNIFMDVTFRPTGSAQTSGQLNLPFAETVTVGNAAPITTNNAINLLFVGTSPSFQLSYVLQTDVNVVPLAPGGTIPFAPTPINTTTTATLNITNIGSGSGQITKITPPAGAAFKLQGTPLLPFSLASGANLALGISYKPIAAVTDTDQVQVAFSSGPPITVNLSGSGTNATFAYDLLLDTPQPIIPPGPISLPDTKVGETSSVIVRVRNSGNGTGIINQPSLAGAGFSLTDLPLFPQTLKPGDSFTFTLNFTPAVPGAVKGNLVIGTDLFSLTGQGLGPKLTFSYTSPAGTKTLGAGDAVVFPQLDVGQSADVTFIVTNGGTLPAPVANIGISEPASPFKIANRPALPASLAPGASLQFTITFSPTTPGFITGTLRIDTTQVSLTGSGTALPPLPAYTITGPSGTVAPQTLTIVRLKLASPYPVALVGSLTITSSGNVVSDGAVQFSSGGRTVTFSIPANTTDANFTGQGPQVFLQTGTVAVPYTITPSFQTQVGAVDVTPNPVTTLTFTIPASAPTLISIQAANETASSFQLIVNGFSTTRSLTSLNVTFRAAPGFNLSASQLSIDIRQLAVAWFQSANSQSLGGQFSVAIAFTFQGTGTLPTGQTLLQSIAGVSATVSNETGTSGSLQVAIP